MTQTLLALDGVTVNHVRVWCHVWEQTLGRPDWDLSYRQVAEACGMSRATAIRCVTWLVDQGWLTRASQTDVSGSRAPNLLAAVIPVGGGVTGETRGGATAETRGGVSGEAHQKSHYPESQYPEKADASPLRGNGRVSLPEYLAQDLDRFANILAFDCDRLYGDDEAERLWLAMRAAGKATPAGWTDSLIDAGLRGVALDDRLEEFRAGPTDGALAASYPVQIAEQQSRDAG